MPITSDASPFTSVTASPMEALDTDELPIELKIPLPASSACSDEEGVGDSECRKRPHSPRSKTVAGGEDIHPKIGEFGIKACEEEVSDTKNGETGWTGSLEELAHFVDLEQYYRHRTGLCQARKDQLSFSCGLDKRLISTLTIAYGNMIDQYKTDDQAGFAGLYDACEQLTVSCGMAGRPVEHPPLSIGRNPAPAEDGSYIQRLSVNHQEAILAFLTQIRTEPFFLADRISNMSSSELTALTSSYHPAGIDYSVLQNHSHGKTQIYSRDSQMMKLSRRMDNLHRFHNEDPFFAMLYGVFDASAKPGSRECLRRTEIWSTVCAQNFVKAFTETRPGSDELAIATLDAFANFDDWPLKPKVETYLMRTLFQGSFLIDAPSKQPVEFSEPIEMHNAKAAIAEADFFENALTGLLDLLTKDGNGQAVPESALAFSHAVLRKIEDPKLRLRAKRYIVCSWYFATFVSSILVYPEVCHSRSLLTGSITQKAPGSRHYDDSPYRRHGKKVHPTAIGAPSATARLRCYPPVVSLKPRNIRTHIKQVPYRSGHALVKPEIRDGILAIFDSFEPPPQNKDDSTLLITDYDEDASAQFLTLSPLDIIGLVQALYPHRSSPSSPQEHESTIVGSDRPSTAGSSTLIAGSSEGGSVLAPSTAPSSAEASVTSNKDLGDVLPPPETSEAELKKESSRASEVTLKDLPSQLRMLCRKIKETLAQAKTSDLVFSSDSWSLIYYSRDGSAVSIGLGTHIRGRKANRSTSGNRKRARIYDSDGKYNTLKAAVIKLLSEEERSGMNALLLLAKATRDNRLHDPLETLIQAAMNKAQLNLDFGVSHEWWRTLESYRALLKSNPNCSFFSVLQDVSQDLKRGIAAAAEDAEVYEVQCRSLDRMQQYNQRLLAGVNQQRKALRVKMWYSSDVRHSGPYEDALHVTRALRSMATSKRSKHPGSLTNWARQRLRGSAFHERAQAQTLEAISAPKDYGGLSKLADEQVEITCRWMTRESIENFCRGEERIHRFCHEVQRSVGKIAGASLLDNPVLWSSNLFKRERYSFDTQRFSPSPIGPPYGKPIAYSPILASQGSPPNGLGFSTSKGRSPTNNTGGFWSAAQASRPSTGPPSYGIQPPLPPTPTSPPKSWSNNSFSPTSPLHAFAPPFPFNPRFGSYLSDENEHTPAKKSFTEDIKRSLLSLLLSDLGYLLWNNGSETDVWINEYDAIGINESKGKQVTLDFTGPLESILNPPANVPTGYQLEQTNSSGRIPSLLPGSPLQVIPLFPFAEAYATLLQNMSLTYDPWKKLRLLYELEDLILRSIQSQESTQSDPLSQRPVNISLRSRSVPRTKATSLEEVIANCTERRAGTIRAKGRQDGHSLLDFVQDTGSVDTVGTDDMVDTLLCLFRDPKLRPKALFRDLQYIAAFIPSETLDQTPQGKAFWDAGLAALALKEDLCKSIIDRGNEITAYHISATKPLDPSLDNPLTSTTLRDAAKLWSITAKEGSPVAARELGLFYLTHPELLPRITMPFSKAKDVFKSVMANDCRTGDKEKGALDPVTFAVVFHWMEIAANGGDKDASDFLRGNGEFKGGR